MTVSVPENIYLYLVENSFGKIAMDIMGPLPVTKRENCYIYILVVEDF